ncbi:MAG: hypothetical protein K1X61_03960 [Chitinophagales bacterium]|nr:hypothetical protein [Chitinophagales bacterium]
MTQLFSSVTEQYISFVAGLLIIAAQLILLRDVYQGKMRPSLLSWLGWALLMGTSLLSQIAGIGWQWSLTGLLLSTIGCFAIFFLSFIINNYQVSKGDGVFLLLGLVCLCIYVVSEDPVITTVFAILADFVAGIPTILSAYKKPEMQKTSAWYFGFISWSFSLLLCFGHEWLYALFPVYLFLYNGAMVYLTMIRKKTALQH